MKPNQFFLIVEGEREETVASLHGAALQWNENRNTRHVYLIAPSGPIGTDAWQKIRELTVNELEAALPRLC